MKPRKSGTTKKKYIFVFFLLTLISYTGIIYLFNFQIISNEKMNSLKLAKEERAILAREVIDLRTKLYKAKLISKKEIRTPIDSLISSQMNEKSKRQKRLEKIKAELDRKEKDKWWGAFLVISFILFVLVIFGFLA